MKNKINILRVIFCANLITAALIMVVFETGLMEPGLLAGNELADYWVSLCSVVLTLFGILIGLKLMTFKRVKTKIHDDGDTYFRWSLCRLALLGTPLLLDTLAYYLLGCEPTCGYLALMLVVTFFFIWPSKDKMLYERDIIYSES